MTAASPKRTGAEGGWLWLPHMHKSRLDFPEADIQAFQMRLFAFSVGSEPKANTIPQP